MATGVPPPSYLFSYRSALQAGQIRLVTLHPKSSSPEDFICISLSRHYSHEAPKYEALSYEWGNAQDLVSVLIDREIFYIGSNLHQALMRLRMVNKPRKIWVDAICINQEDRKEKKEQVSCMAVIYNGAIGTLMWIGEETESTQYYFQGIQAMAAAAYMLRYAQTRLKILNNLASVIDWLGRHRYFSRAWMTQEIIASNTLTLKCGSFEMPFMMPAAAFYLLSLKESHQLNNHTSTNLARLYSLRLNYHIYMQSSERIDRDAVSEQAIFDLRRTLWASYWLALEEKLDEANLRKKYYRWKASALLDDKKAFEYGEISSLEQPFEYSQLKTKDLPCLVTHHLIMSTITKSWFGNKGKAMGEYTSYEQDQNIYGMELLDLLIQDRNKEASDPLDKVYAILSIAKAGEVFCGEPDYTKTVQELYTEIAEQCLKSPRLGIKLLCCSQPSYSTLDLPSWVPDWSQPWYGGLFHRKNYATGLDLVPQITYEPSMKAITVQGIEVAAVNSVGGIDANDLEMQFHCATPIRDRLRPMLHKLGWIENEYSCWLLISLLTAGRSHPMIYSSKTIITEIGYIMEFEGYRPYSFDNIVWDSFLNELVWSQGRWDIFRISSSSLIMGIGPANTQRGDMLCILLGSKTPSILRCRGDNRYEFIGECYVPCMMSGDFMKWARRDEKIPVRSFTIL